jgi:hypothetical protein
MTDFLGNELNVGDEVIYIRKHNSSAVELARGVVTRLTNTLAIIEDQDGIWTRGCTSQNIYKINIQ